MRQVDLSTPATEPSAAAWRNTAQERWPAADSGRRTSSPSDHTCHLCFTSNVPHDGDAPAFVRVCNVNQCKPSLA